MSLYRRGQSKVWWVCVHIGGQKVRRSSGATTKSAAEEFETRLRGTLWRQHKLGERPAHTWDEAVARWFASATGRGRLRESERLRWFTTFLAGVPLAEIDSHLIQKLRSAKCSSTSPSTANRHMALLRMILRKAEREWEWIDRAPTVPMYPTPLSEPRFLTRKQFETLLQALPSHLATLAEFSVETGARMRNVTHLQWEQVDFERRLMVVSASRAKAGRTLSIPLSSRALSILRSLTPASTGTVFRFRGREMDDANGSTFKLAASSAGVPWLRWHDLRHTWASWHIQAGTPPHVLQELGGWRSYEMVRRYAHLNPQHLAAYADATAPTRAATTTADNTHAKT